VHASSVQKKIVVHASIYHWRLMLCVLGTEDLRNLNPTWERKWREAANFGRSSSADSVILHAMQAAPPATILIILPVSFFLSTSFASRACDRLSTMFCPKMINTRDQLLSSAKKQKKSQNKTFSWSKMHSTAMRSIALLPPS
jgi:hypothetical protein